MRIPLDYYRILGLPLAASEEQLRQAYSDRIVQLPREYSQAAISSRKQLIEEAYVVLSDPKQRSTYDQLYLAHAYDPDNLAAAAVAQENRTESTKRGSDTQSLGIEITQDELVGALLILQELGEYELVLKLGRPYLVNKNGTKSVIKSNNLADEEIYESAEHPDVVLTVALACLELGREQWQQGHYENAAISLETGQELLVREGLFTSVQAEIQADLYKLQPYRILELLALPEANTTERSQGLELLQNILDDRGGIDGNGNDESGVNIDDFLRFIQQLRYHLTVAEQHKLFEAESKRPSAVATYLAVYALIAQGFVQRQPALIRQAKQMLMRLGKHQDVHLEQSLCALLLAQTEEATRVLELSQEYEAVAFVREKSQDSPDLIPGLYLYTEHWLQNEVFHHFRDLAQQQVSLKDYFDNPQVQAYLEALPINEEINYDVRDVLDQKINNYRQHIFVTTTQERIILGAEIEISVNLKQAEIIENNCYILQISQDEALGNELNILLSAPGFQLNGDNTASLLLDSDTAQETQTARFRLTAIRPGNATITVELYRGDIFETKLETQIQVADIDEATFIPQRITTQPRPVPQPDFILRIQTISNLTNSTCEFQYQLKSFQFSSVFTDDNIYISKVLSICWLEQVWRLLATTLENISHSLLTEAKSHLISLGQYLFEQILPTELQTDFRILIPQNSTFTLLIIADQEAWIPWELLYDGQRFLGDRFIIGRWLQELNDTRPYEFPVGAVNVAHYANVEQPQLWATLLEAPSAPPPQPLPAGVLHDSTEAIRGLHLIRYSQSSDADLRNAPVTLDNINDTEDIELQMRPAKLNLRRNRPFVTLSYVKNDTPELTALENTWASAFIRAGCSGFTGSLWAVEPAVEAAFISCFYNRLWAGTSLGEAFYTSRQLARTAAPDSLDWLAYVLFGDPMARPYRPVAGDGYAIVEPIGREIDDPLPPGAIARFRVTLRRNPPVWHEDRVIEVAENLVFENLQVHIVTYGLQVIPDLHVTMTLTAKGDYLGWFTLVVPHEITDTLALVQVYFADGMRPIHSLNFSLKIENGREE